MKPAPRFRMQGVSKRFGATVALENVSFELEAGEVRALVGENGAGKSTLVKCLSGVHTTDAGTMQLDGAAYAPRGPAEARDRGIALIHQELSIAPDLCVEDNVMLGREHARAGIVRRQSNAAAARAALTRLGHGELALSARAGNLPIALQQVVEIARALAADARLVVLDEPTSSLASADAERLFALVAELAAQGIAVVYISHFLEEVTRVATRATVLRDGRVVDEGSMAEMTRERLLASMAGRDLEHMFPRVPHAIGAPVVVLSSVAGRRAPSAVDLTLYRGEILGIAGLVGSGRSELLRVIYGLDPLVSGTITVNGARHERGSPRASLRRGIGFLSEDRKGEGLAPEMSIEDNLTLSRLARHARFGWLALKARRAEAQDWMERVRCRASGPAQTLNELSGGNQQKIALARLLHDDAEILLLDEPTRGIDVGTKSEIYRMLGDLAAAGKTIVMTSSYLPELLNVCDRIAVMCRGELVEARPVERWSTREVLEFATGARGRRR